MRVCLFDWHHGGHHAEFAKAFAAALLPDAEVILAASDKTLGGVGDIGVTPLSLGEERPRPSAEGDGDGRGKAELANAELDLIESVVRETKPDHLVLLWADPVLRWLLRRPSLPTAVSIYVFFAQMHYRRVYGTNIGAANRVKALYKELNVIRWLQRRDAHCLFGFDPVAVRRWSRYPRANARYLPEPPLNQPPPVYSAAEKSGCLLFGYLDERKGIDRIAAATEEGCEGLVLRLCGEVAPEYEGELARQVERIRANGVEIEEHLERVPYATALDNLARAQVVLLSFGWVPPGSRVLLEAATCGTPVIGSRLGVVGHLIEKHGLGLTADPDDPRSIRAAIKELAMDPHATQRFSAGLRDYAEKLNADLYRRQVRAGLGLPVDDRPTPQVST